MYQFLGVTFCFLLQNRRKMERESKYTQNFTTGSTSDFFVMTEKGDQDGSMENNFRGFEVDDSSSMPCPKADFCVDGVELFG